MVYTFLDLFCSTEPEQTAVHTGKCSRTDDATVSPSSLCVFVGCFYGTTWCIAPRTKKRAKKHLKINKSAVISAHWHFPTSYWFISGVELLVCPQGSGAQWQDDIALTALSLHVTDLTGEALRHDLICLPRHWIIASENISFAHIHAHKRASARMRARKTHTLLEGCHYTPCSANLKFYTFFSPSCFCTLSGPNAGSGRQERALWVNTTQTSVHVTSCPSLTNRWTRFSWLSMGQS